MPAIYEHAHEVLVEETDGQGHVNNVVFLQWMNDAAVAHAAVQGWSAEACREAGVAWVARSHYIEYRRPAFPGEQIVVRTWIADMQRMKSTRKYRIERIESDGGRGGRWGDGGTSRGDMHASGPGRVLLARAESVWVLVDAKTGKPKRIPPEIERSFELVVED